MMRNCLLCGTELSSAMHTYRHFHYMHILSKDIAKAKARQLYPACKRIAFFKLSKVSKNIFSKEHYAAIAEVISKERLYCLQAFSEEKAAWKIMVLLALQDALASMFFLDNSKFSVMEFVEACEPQVERETKGISA